MSIIVPQPESKFNGLLRRLEVLEMSGTNEIELKRIELEANTMLKTPSTKSEGLCILGMLEVMRNKYDIASDLLRRSVSTADASWHAYALENQMVAYRKMGRVSDSLECATRLFQCYPDDIAILRAAGDAFSAGYCISKSLEVLHRLEKLNALRDDVELMNSEAISQLLRREKVDEKDVMNVIRIACGVLEERRIRLFGGERDVAGNGESSINFWANICPAEAADLNWIIADTLSEQLEDSLDHIVTVGVICRGPEEIAA